MSKRGLCALISILLASSGLVDPCLAQYESNKPKPYYWKPKDKEEAKKIIKDLSELMRRPDPRGFLHFDNFVETKDIFGEEYGFFVQLEELVRIEHKRYFKLVVTHRFQNEDEILSHYFSAADLRLYLVHDRSVDIRADAVSVNYKGSGIVESKRVSDENFPLDNAFLVVNPMIELGLSYVLADNRVQGKVLAALKDLEDLVVREDKGEIQDLLFWDGAPFEHSDITLLTQKWDFNAMDLAYVKQVAIFLSVDESVYGCANGFALSARGSREVGPLEVASQRAYIFMPAPYVNLSETSILEPSEP